MTSWRGTNASLDFLLSLSHPPFSSLPLFLSLHHLSQNLDFLLLFCTTLPSLFLCFYSSAIQSPLPGELIFMLILGDLSEEVWGILGTPISLTPIPTFKMVSLFAQLNLFVVDAYPSSRRGPHPNPTVRPKVTNWQKNTKTAKKWFWLSPVSTSTLPSPWPSGSPSSSSQSSWFIGFAGSAHRKRNLPVGT